MDTSSEPSSHSTITPRGDQRLLAPEPPRAYRSERFLAAIEPYERIYLISHVNPDPDALASMLGLIALIRAKQPGKIIQPVYEGMIARAENQMMVQLLEIPLLPLEQVDLDDQMALVMVDTQPRAGQADYEERPPTVVLDHHETPGDLTEVTFVDLRPDLGATSTIVAGYLIEQGIPPTPSLATGLLYGIESETTGFPREASPQDDGALAWLFPRADKDLLARIRNPKLPLSYFAIYQHALAHSRLHENLVFIWCGEVPQPDIIAEIADFLVKFDQVAWAVSVGVFEGQFKVSARVSATGARCGHHLREALLGLGPAGGHDKRAGGVVRISELGHSDLDSGVRLIRDRILEELGIRDHEGRQLLSLGTKDEDGIPPGATPKVG